MLLQQTLDKMRGMKMHQMARSLEERLSKADHQDLSVEEMIGLIVDDEFTARENARLEARLRGAKFKEKAACMEDIDYKANRGLKKQTMLELGQLKWVEKKQNIALTGPSGAGKSYLAQALGHRACRSGYRVIYVRLPKLLSALMQSRTDGTYANLLKRFEKANVLILDDLGISELRENERRDLLEMIEDRYDVGSTVITSQLAIKDWHAYFGGGRAADSLCDRLVHNCHRIELLAQADSQRKLRARLD
ncbi:MAG: ATP-binding protein [Bdellovibrionaceae bacterium]|nr:ATP-binding protein [Pseudobdellovibrionaceae bacterium]